jgi:type IV secretion system protein VirD4
MSELILGRSAKSRSRSIGFTTRAQSEAADLITYSGEGHLITFAPTGTGKTSSSVITNALTHAGPLIALDIKGEIYAATADARRKMGQDVKVLDLSDGGHPGSLNPLDLITYSGTDHAAIAQFRSGDGRTGCL